MSGKNYQQTIRPAGLIATKEYEVYGTESKSMYGDISQPEERLPPVPPKINYRDELIYYFFNHMLKAIVVDWQPDDIIPASSIPSAEKIITSKPYTQVCPEDMSLMSIHSVHESMINFGKTQSGTSIKVSEKRSKKKKKGKTGTDSKLRSLQKPSAISTVTHSTITSGVSKSVMDSRMQCTTDIQDKSIDTDWFMDHSYEVAEIKFKNGNTYQGEIKSKLFHGEGTFTWIDGTAYTGTFHRGEITGNGQMIFSDLSRYQGQVYYGLRHGLGTLVVANSNAIYNGKWSFGARHGKGWYLYEPNNWYNGEWKYDQMEGEGLRHYVSGARYHGKWKEGRRHGYGCAVMKNNDFYSGEWCEGMRKGYGEYTWNSFFNKYFCFPSENKYCGSWEKNMRQGVGVINFGMEGGGRYAGCFDHNEKHGPGVVICENGLAIESNPLFINDKPIHLTTSGKINVDEDYQMESSDLNQTSDFDQQSISNKLNPSYDQQVEGKMSSIYVSSNYIVPKRRLSTYNLIKKQAKSPSVELDKSALANIELCKIKFPCIKENFLSLNIPINTPSEQIIINHYLNQVLQKIDTYEEIYMRKAFSELSPNETSSPRRMLSVRCPESLVNVHTTLEANQSFKEDNLLHVNRDKLQSHESKWLRRTITLHLPRLVAVYDQYATITCSKSMPFKPLMIRLFLWQMYRDCFMPEKGISLVEIDHLLYDNPDTEMENLHNPFEIIYFCQFLQSLMSVAWKLHGDECITFVHEGILQTTFGKFLEVDIYPHVGHHRGSALFDYFDVLPIESAYKWYLSFDEPMTVLQFLQQSCTIKKKDPPSFLRAKENASQPQIQFGLNAMILGQYLVYLQEQQSPLVTEVPLQNIDSYSDDPYRFKLYFLRKLGAKTVLSCVKSICPGIVKEDLYIDLQYQIVFLEFYEAVFMCTQLLINKEKCAKDKAMKAELERSKVDNKLEYIKKKSSGKRRSKDRKTSR